MTKLVNKRSKYVYNVDNVESNSSSNAFDVLMKAQSNPHPNSSSSYRSSSSRSIKTKKNKCNNNGNSSAHDGATYSQQQDNMSSSFLVPPGYSSGQSLSNSIIILAENPSQRNPLSASEIVVYLPTNDSNFFKTQPEGYCSFLAIQQQFIHHISSTKSCVVVAGYLTNVLSANNRPIWKDGMQEYLYLCMQAGLPKLGLTLRTHCRTTANLHQSLFQQWLHILAVWAKESSILSKLIITVFQQRQEHLDSFKCYPHSFPLDLWPTALDIAEFILPFPVSIFVEPDEKFGFQYLQSTNVMDLGVTASVRSGYVGFNFFTLSVVSGYSGFILNSGNHFYWGGEEKPFSAAGLEEARIQLLQCIPRLPSLSVLKQTQVESGIKAPLNFSSGHSPSRSIHLLTQNPPLEVSLAQVSVYIPINNQDYNDTDSSGYCGFLVILQQYLYFITSSNNIVTEAENLTTSLNKHGGHIWKEDMHSFLYNCLAASDNKYRLKLLHNDPETTSTNQALFQQWLNILAIWALESHSLTLIIHNVLVQRQWFHDLHQSYPSFNPSEARFSPDEFAFFHFPFPVTIFVETPEHPGFLTLLSTNVNNTGNSSLFGPVFNNSIISRIALVKGYMVYASQQFHWGGITRLFTAWDVTLAYVNLLENFKLPSVCGAPILDAPTFVPVFQPIASTDVVPMRIQIQQRRSYDFFFQNRANQAWLINYLKKIPGDSLIYPDEEVREGFRDTLDWFEVSSSTQYGKEVTFKRDLPANSFAFIYAGIPTTGHGEYIMSSKNFNISPDFSDKFCFGSRCNEYIWDQEMNNLKHVEQGLVTSKCKAKYGDTAWFCYGNSYDWSNLTLKYVADITSVLRIIASKQDTYPPEWESIVKASHPVTRSQSIDALIKLFYDPRSDIDQPVEPLASLMHNLNPPKGLSANQWIEFMLRSRWTYANFCFRRRDDPEGLYYSGYPVIVHANSQPKRACAMTSICSNYPYNPAKHRSIILKPLKKKRRSHIHEDIFVISQLSDIKFFKFNYQPTLTHPKCAYQPILEQSVRTPYFEDFQSSQAEPCNSVDNTPEEDLEVGPSDDVTPQISSHKNLQYCSQEQPTDLPQWPYETTDDNLRTLFFNVDGSSIHNIFEIVGNMEQHKIDIACIVDPRLDKSFNSLRNVVERNGYLVRLYYVPQAASKRKDGRVGGILFMVGSRIRNVKIERVCPEGSFSILHGVFGLGATPVHFLGAYWPIFNTESQSLWQRIQRRYNMNPIEAIQAKMSSKLLVIHRNQETGFVFGDFNSDVTSSRKKDKYNLAAFAQANWLSHASTPTQLQSHSYGKLSHNCSGQSRIDYQFHNGFNIIPNRVSCFPSDMLHHIGAHRCLLGSYYLTDMAPQTGRYKHLIPTCNIDLTNVLKTDKLKAGLEELYNNVKHISDPEEAIEEVTYGSVRAAKAVFAQKKRKRFNHFSPQAAALHINLNFLRKISNGVIGSKAHVAWNPRAFKRSMKSILVQWKKQLTKVLCKSEKSEVSLHEILTAHADCYGFLYWGDKTLNQTRHVIGVAYSETKKRMHARRCRDMRKSFSTKVQHMEEKCTMGKLKETIAYVMGPKRKYYNFQELLVQGEPISDPKEIHETITAHFEDWFRANPDTGQVSNDLNAYTDLMLPWPSFKTRFSKTKISDSLLLSLHRALNSGPSVAKLNTMDETLRAIPTPSEFQAVIDHAKNGTAPGLSGLTYSIIKLWPGILVDFVFEQLLALWSTNSFPNHWSDKWIAPIPKTTDPTLESLRPIALLEVLRKLWVAIIIHRIQTLFQTGGYLHPSQHGCLRGVGTDEAIMEITNILEATKEKQGEVYVASWDMRRAFDRVPKSFLIFSWLRMGVPLDIARYLVELDIDGTTIVKTPFAQSQLYRHGSIVKEDIGFTAETGCAQGDPQSAISWNTFIDILLVALHDKENNNNFFWITMDYESRNNNRRMWMTFYQYYSPVRIFKERLISSRLSQFYQVWRFLSLNSKLSDSTGVTQTSLASKTLLCILLVGYPILFS